MIYILIPSLLLIAAAVAFFLFKKRKQKPQESHPVWDTDTYAEGVSNVYVIRTHLYNDHVKKIFTQMQEQLGAENVFVLFDETNGALNHPHTKWNDPAGVTIGPAIITVNENDCQQINKLHAEGRKAGSKNRVEAQVYACYKAIKKDYDYLWFIEYDVYSNDFRKALRRCDAIKADMLTKATANNKQKDILTIKQNKKWHWWPYIVGEMSTVPMKDRRGCFFPINRFSKRFLAVLEQNLSKSTGFCEVYFPTLCHVNGLVLETMPQEIFGEYKFKPVITSEQVKSLDQNDARLYHPVKELF